MGGIFAQKQFDASVGNNEGHFFQQPQLQSGDCVMVEDRLQGGWNNSVRLQHE